MALNWIIRYQRKHRSRKHRVHDTSVPLILSQHQSTRRPVGRSTQVFDDRTPGECRRWNGCIRVSEWLRKPRWFHHMKFEPPILSSATRIQSQHSSAFIPNRQFECDMRMTSEDHPVFPQFENIKVKCSQSVNAAECIPSISIAPHPLAYRRHHRHVIMLSP